MPRRISPWLALIPLIVTPIVAQSADDVLRSLRSGHPRLFLLESDLPRVQQTIRDEPLAQRWQAALLAEAEKTLHEPPIEHKFSTIRPRLLDKSRLALRRISTLAGLYRLTGDRRFAERARQEMLAITAFVDWGPKYFLDVAEMTTALAIGYDWLFDFLSAADRVTIRQALVEKGLKQSLPLYANQRGWPVVSHNWNQVCNGGMSIGALAVADEEPALATSILTAARQSVPLAMRTFDPDGGWPEGPGYWSYATQYNVLYLAALESALGTDFGLKRSRGFDHTGHFHIYSVGPTGHTFNYADAHEAGGPASPMFWLARTFDQPVYAGHERAMAGDRGNIFHLIWFDGRGRAPQADDLPRDALFHNVEVAFFRSDWNDPRAVYLGFKGGDNRANHAHLDLGSFVLDALGQRWAIDLGPDDYGLPGYFGKERWTYYRLRTESHNTLTLDGENQNPRGAAPLVAFHSAPQRSFAVADLTAGYTPKVKRLRRGVALLDRRQVLVQDELDAAQPTAVVWSFFTRAKIKTQGALARLTQRDAMLTARILAPADARFEILPASAPPQQHQQPDVHNLAVRIAAPVGPTRIVVLLTPGDEPNHLPRIDAFDEWEKAAAAPPASAP